MPNVGRSFLALALVLVFVISGCSSGGDSAPATGVKSAATIVPVESPQIDAPRVKLESALSTTYYTVNGSTTEEIFASIEQNGPSDEVGRQGSGLTSVEWEYAWTGDRTPSGACSIRELTVKADIVIELPLHAREDQLPAVLQERWREFADGVAQHEQRHVDIYLQGAEDVKGALEEIGVADDCDALTSQIDGIWTSEQDRINRLQQNFHNEENLRLEASREPLSKQIEDNRAELATLQQQIADLDAQIAFLRAEIAVFDTEVESIDSQVKQINEQFPNELPDTVRQRLQQLVEQSNDLLAKYNERVEEHNAAVVQRSALSEQYDSLIASTNELVEQFNWTR